MSVDKLLGLLKHRDVNWFNAAVNISLKNKFVYIENPKVASSTIKMALHANEVISLRNVSVGPHPDILTSPFVKPYQLSNNDLADILFGTDFFRFTFVRNPFDRFLSAYLDKICGNQPEKQQVDVRWEKKHGKKKDMLSFADFIEVIEETPDTARDKHWRTQSALTMINQLNFHHVGRLETFNMDIVKIQSMGRIDFRNIKEFSPHKTDAAKKRMEHYKSKKLIEKVSKMYEIDFEKFAYSKEI